MPNTLKSTTAPAAPVARRPVALALVLGALFVGTVIAVDPSGLVPSGPARWTVTLVVMGAAMFGLLLRPVRAERLTGLVWLALVAWLFLASIAGADALHAWIGTPDRRLGWFAWCTFPLLFLCGQAIATERDRRVVMRGAAIAAVFLGVWCIVERAGWSLIDESFAGHRVGGPFAQPAYVGAAAVLLIPIAAGIALDRNGSRAWRSIGVLGALSSGAALLLSQTRGAWLGVGVVLVLLGVRHGSVVRRRWREGALAAAGSSTRSTSDTVRREAASTIGPSALESSNTIRYSEWGPRVTGWCFPRSCLPPTCSVTARRSFPTGLTTASLMLPSVVESSAGCSTPHSSRCS